MQALDQNTVDRINSIIAEVNETIVEADGYANVEISGLEFWLSYQDSGVSLGHVKQEWREGDPEEGEDENYWVLCWYPPNQKPDEDRRNMIAPPVEGVTEYVAATPPFKVNGVGTLES